MWFERHPTHGLAGLAGLLGGTGALAEAAREWAMLLRRQGHLDLITFVASSLPPELGARVRAHVIDVVVKEYAPFPAGEPMWFAEAAGELAPGKPPGWAEPAVLAPILSGNHRLTDLQLGTVVAAVRDPKRGTSLLTAIKKHMEPRSLDAFAWSLFHGWISDGAPSAHKWAMLAVGLIGGDSCVLKLTPLIRAWPGESQHARAVTGLEVLRQIGSDLALMQLNGIAQKLPFKGLKTKAAEYMEAIAKDKGLTRSELEDRIVPDCDLDERGQRSFDFGPRQFSFALSPELKPVLRDTAGKVLPNLPKPNAKDNATKAEAALAKWKILKKQVSDTASLQAARLEQAMVVGRRWRIDDIQRLLVDHPLMIHLIRLLVWEAIPAAGGAAMYFRVSEEREIVGVEDDALDLDKFAEVGLVHPLRMTDVQRSAWGQVMSDYGIVPPFPQLGRPVHHGTPAELSAGSLTRFTGMRFPAPTLVFGLEKMGWHRGMAMDGGGFYEHQKSFAAAGCTAIVVYDGCVSMGYIQPEEELKVTECFLVPGIYTAEYYPEHKNRLALKNADPVVISEVLKDMLQLAEKAK